MKEKWVESPSLLDWVKTNLLNATVNNGGSRANEIRTLKRKLNNQFS